MRWFALFHLVCAHAILVVGSTAGQSSFLTRPEYSRPEWPDSVSFHAAVYTEVPFGLNQLRANWMTFRIGLDEGVLALSIRHRAHDELGLLLLAPSWSFCFPKMDFRVMITPLLLHARKGELGGALGVGFRSGVTWNRGDMIDLGYFVGREPQLNGVDYGTTRHGGVISVETGGKSQYRLFAMIEHRADLGMGLISGIGVSSSPGMQTFLQWRSDTGSLVFSTSLRLSRLETSLGSGWHPALGLSHGYGFGVYR